jgi:signal transduction histidine kinase
MTDPTSGESELPMGILHNCSQFLRSKSCRGFFLYLGFSAALSGAVGYGLYYSNLAWFKEHKTDEKVIALRLVDAFVTRYSAIRAQFGTHAPVPASFRASAIEIFSKQPGSTEEFRLRWVGRVGREIATAPADEDMARTIEAFAATTDLTPKSKFVNVAGHEMFRTIYPSFAREQSCVDCHNQIQADKTPWRLNDLMGAFAIDVPVSSFLHTSLLQSVALGLGLFLVLGTVGLAFALLYFRQMVERDLAGTVLERRVEDRTAELRAAQDELVLKERLSTLGQITATVAHELRNPLSAVQNTVFAIKSAVASSGLNLDRPIMRVERNIRRCERIISDLLNFTRNLELQKSTVKIDVWLDDLLNDLPVPQHIKVVRQLGASNCEAYIDVDRMRQVVINLMDNAVQALADNESSGRVGQITVSTNAVENHLEIVIKDTGPGIASDVLPKVFEPLFSTKSIGTGLGLPIVKQIIEQHSGTIHISSVPGSGATVVVQLPIPNTHMMAA